MVRNRKEKTYKTKLVLASLTAGAVMTVARPVLLSKVYAAADSYEWGRIEGVNLPNFSNYTSTAQSADGTHLLLSTFQGGENATQPSPLYISNNSGTSWENVAPELDPGINNDWTSVDSSDNGQVMVATSSQGEDLGSEEYINGKIFISKNGGGDWNNVSPVDNDGWEKVVVSGDGSKIVAIDSNDNLLHVTENDGASWTTVDTPITSDLKSVSISSDGDTILLLGGESSHQLYITRNDGENWNNVTPNNGSNTYVLSQDMSADGSKIITIADTWTNEEDARSVFVSGNSGNNWTESDLSSEDSNNLTSSAISDDGSTMSVIGSDENGYNSPIFISDDDGTTWHTQYPDQGGGDTNGWIAMDINSDGSQVIVADEENAYLGNFNSPGSNTASLVNSGNSGAIMITSPDGTVITCSSGVKESNLSAQDPSYQYPLGLVDFCFDTKKASNEVALTFVTNLKPAEAVIRKYNPNTRTYSNVPGTSVTETTYEGKAALRVSYSIVDNGPLDLNTELGKITDPVGIGIAPTPGDLADTGESTATPLFIASTLITVGFGAITLRRLMKQSRQ